jgi:hypothetical protein
MLTNMASGIQNRIISALNAKNPQFLCPLCGKSEWAVHDGMFYHHQEIKAENITAISGRELPCAALVCKVCGNTHFISLEVLAPDLVR